MLFSGISDERIGKNPPSPGLKAVYTPFTLQNIFFGKINVIDGIF